MFDEKTLTTLATKAVLESITPEMRAELLTRAISSMFEMEESRIGHYGKARTKFQAAFDKALDGALFQVARDLLQEPEYQQALRAQTRIALDQYLTRPDANSLSGMVLQALTLGTEKLFDNR